MSSWLLFASLFTQFEVGEEILMQEMIWRRLPDQSGSSCQLQYLSKLTVQEIHEDEIIVRYESDRLEHPANCRNGVLLSFEPHYLDSHRDYYREYQNKKQALQKIKKGESSLEMAGYHVGDQFSVRDWSWVIVEEKIGKFREGDLCRAVSSGVLEIAGFYLEKRLSLMSYQNFSGEYQECPNGTLSFIDLNQSNPQ